MWRCKSCNYIWDDEEAPDSCPHCGAAAAQFGALSDKAADLIESSRFTNSLLMQLHLLMEQVIELAEDGIDDNLDPRCVNIFTLAMEQAEAMQQLVKAQLQEHAGKGKWG